MIQALNNVITFKSMLLKNDICQNYKIGFLADRRNIYEKRCYAKVN